MIDCTHEHEYARLKYIIYVQSSVYYIVANNFVQR
jgi:hypothetical protein